MPGSRFVNLWCGHFTFLGLEQVMVSDLASPPLLKSKGCQGRVQPEFATQQGLVED